MAYTFRKLEEGLGLRPSDALLNPMAAQARPQERPLGAAPAGSTDLAVSGVQAGDLKGNLAERGLGADEYTKASAADPMKFIEANKGAQFGSLIDPMKAAAATATTDLKAKADAYVKAVPTFQGIDQNTLNEGVSKGGYAFDKIVGALGAQYKPAEAPVAALPPTSDEVDALRSSSGREALLRRAGGDNYTEGMARLDQALLQQGGQYKEQLADAERTQKALQDTAGLEQARTAAAAAKGGMDFAAQQAALRKQLEGMASGLETDVDTRVAREAAIRKAADTQARVAAKANLVGLMAAKDKDIAARRGMEGADIASLNKAALQLAGMRTNLDSYIKGGDAYTVGRGDVVTADEGERFGRIMSLLGKGDSLGTPGAGAPKQVGASYDPALFAAIDQELAAESAARKQAVAAEAQRVSDEAFNKKMDELPPFGGPTPTNILPDKGPGAKINDALDIASQLPNSIANQIIASAAAAPAGIADAGKQLGGGLANVGKQLGGNLAKGGKNAKKALKKIF